MIGGTSATVPYKRSKYHDLTGYEQTVNRTISTRRAAVERAIGHLKNWKILATGYRDSSNYPISSESPAASNSTDLAGDDRARRALVCWGSSP